MVIEIKEEEWKEINGEDEEKTLGSSASKTNTNAKSGSKQQQQRENEMISFNKIVGLSTYSNSRSTVLSYAAMFETLLNERAIWTNKTVT